MTDLRVAAGQAEITPRIGLPLGGYPGRRRFEASASIAVACTHTHSGPSTLPLRGIPLADEGCFDYLGVRMVEAGRQALADRRCCRGRIRAYLVCVLWSAGAHARRGGDSAAGRAGSGGQAGLAVGSSRHQLI